MKSRAVAVALPWMLPDREERRRRLVAFYEARGAKTAHATAAKYCDDPLANLCGDSEPILEELRGGKLVEDLSREWGVPVKTIYSHLLTYAPEEFRAASALRALERKKVCEDSLEAATDNVQTSKWKSLLQASQWDLERLAPKLYGLKQAQEGLSITVNLDRSCGGTVDVSGGGVSQRLTIAGTEASVSAQDGR